MPIFKTESDEIQAQNNASKKALKTLPPLSYDEYTAKVKNLKTLSDVTAFTRELLAPTIQAMLEVEMDNHLGYAKHDNKGDLLGNSRNGYSSKILKTSEAGPIAISIPRDRKSEFVPLVVKKYETVESGIEEKIVSMYAKGMTTRDIESHMQEIYGVSISAEMVSQITNNDDGKLAPVQILP